MNLFSILEERARGAPDRAAIIGPDGAHTTFGDLEGLATRLAGALAARGLDRGDRAVVLVPVSRDLYLVLLALLKLGATAVFVEPALGPLELARCCERAAPRAFIGVWRAHLLRARSRVLRTVPLAVVVGRGVVPGAIPLERLLTDARPAMPTQTVDDGEPALLTYTSGTGGLPKAVERSHGLLRRQHEVLTAAFPVLESDRGLSMAPLFALSDLGAGAAVVLPPAALRSGRPRRAAAALADRGVTVARTNSRFADAIARACESAGATLPAVRALFVGGSPVEAPLLGRLRAVLPNAELHVVYGSSEAEPIAAIRAEAVVTDTAALTALGRGHCVGTPIPPTAVRIESADGAALFPSPAPSPAASVGEVVVAGPHVNAASWHHTGDSGYVDGAGRLWLVGRESDRVRRAGRVLHAYTVEPLVEALPFVQRCALIGAPDQVLGERSVLVVSVRHALFGRSERERWRAQIARLCEARGIPIDDIRWTRAMPLDARHRSKIRRAALRQLLQPSLTAR